ncbi:Zn-finger protein [Rhizoctonia solani]|uniref:Zn-finger protein n=1 Tax=Rhizoctonia solani TaxID=456999 RepID=A0A8H7H448_9AGAM|nr:Zn-finger protein [Rhizoctonia solani]
MFRKISAVKKHISNTLNCHKKRDQEIHELNRTKAVGSEPNTYDEDNGPDIDYKLVDVQDVEMQGGGQLGDQVPGSDAADQVPEQPGFWLPGPDEYNFRMFVPEDESNATTSSTGALQYDKKLRVWIEDYPVKTIAEFLLESRLSVKEREQFLRLNKIKGRMPWSSNYKLMADVDKLPCRSGWRFKVYQLDGPKGTEKVIFWYRNTADVFKELFAILALKDEYHFRPKRHYAGQKPGKHNRQYGDANALQAWWDLQQKFKDEYATMGRYIIASDQTPLTGFCGNKKAHPVYFTIANLPKHIRRAHSNRAMVLIGYLPIPDLDCEPNDDKAQAMQTKLFNTCMRDLLQPLTNAERVGMEVVCADGGVRRIYPTLSSAIADYPEQCRNACSIGSFCPVCLVQPDSRGDLHQNTPLREKIPTLEAIKEHCKEGSPNFEDFGLHDQWPWWNRHTYIDIATMHTPDLLHQCHKGVFKDHLAKWLPKIIGKKELDLQYKLMPRHQGIRHFKRGISKLSRSTGREAKEMMKVFLPVAADAGPKVVDATLALLKFMYLAHSSTLTETKLEEMDQHLATFHQNKAIFKQWLKTKRKFHNIPKFHQLQHYTHSICMLGTPDGYNTEAPERLHIDLTKAGFNASNKIDDTELEQMAEYIMRMDALALHRAYLTYMDSPEGNEDLDWDERAESRGETWWEEGEMGDEDYMSDTLEGGTQDEDGESKASQCNSDKEEGEDNEQDDLADGCVVDRVIEGRVRVSDQGGNGDNLDTDVGMDLAPKLYYPTPELVTAKGRRKAPSTVDHLVKAHCATNLVRDISTFLKKLNPTWPTTILSPDDTLHIWTVIRLFHPTLPFKALEPPQVNHVRARPTKFDSIQRVRRVGQFDTVLVLTYPDKAGIHRA